MSDTPRTDRLENGIQRRKELRGFGMPEDDRDRVELCRKLERDLAAATKRADDHFWWRKELADKLHDAETKISELTKRAEEAEANAKRYNVLRNKTHGTRILDKCYFVVIPPDAIGNIMQGSIGEHLDNACDEAMRNG